MQLHAVIVAATLAMGPARDNPAGIQNADARAHFDAGMEAWLAKDYALAERELEAAYAIEPRAQLLYSLGQLARLQGDCTRAVERFEAYLDTDPPAAAAEDTRTNIRRCEPYVEAPEPEPEPEAVTPAPPPPARAPVERPGPDALGVTLTVVGATLTGVGLGVFGGAFAAQQRAEHEPDVAAFERGVRRARGMYWSGIGLATAGAALAIAGIVRLVIVERRRKGGMARR